MAKFRFPLIFSIMFCVQLIQAEDPPVEAHNAEAEKSKTSEKNTEAPADDQTPIEGYPLQYGLLKELMPILACPSKQMSRANATDPNQTITWHIKVTMQKYARDYLKAITAEEPLGTEAIKKLLNHSLGEGHLNSPTAPVDKERVAQIKSSNEELADYLKIVFEKLKTEHAKDHFNAVAIASGNKEDQIKKHVQTVMGGINDVDPALSILKNFEAKLKEIWKTPATGCKASDKLEAVAKKTVKEIEEKETPDEDSAAKSPSTKTKDTEHLAAANKSELLTKMYTEQDSNGGPSTSSLEEKALTLKKAADIKPEDLPRLNEERAAIEKDIAATKKRVAVLGKKKIEEMSTEEEKEWKDKKAQLDQLNSLRTQNELLDRQVLARDSGALISKSGLKRELSADIINAPAALKRAQDDYATALENVRISNNIKNDDIKSKEKELIGLALLEPTDNQVARKHTPGSAKYNAEVGFYKAHKALAAAKLLNVENKEQIPQVQKGSDLIRLQGYLENKNLPGFEQKFQGAQGTIRDAVSKYNTVTRNDDAAGEDSKTPTREIAGQIFTQHDIARQMARKEAAEQLKQDNWDKSIYKSKFDNVKPSADLLSDYIFAGYLKKATPNWDEVKGGPVTPSEDTKAAEMKSETFVNQSDFTNSQSLLDNVKKYNPEISKLTQIIKDRNKSVPPDVIDFRRENAKTQLKALMTQYYLMQNQPAEQLIPSL